MRRGHAPWLTLPRPREDDVAKAGKASDVANAAKASDVANTAKASDVAQAGNAGNAKRLTPYGDFYRTVHR